jgi:hypothetical protein
MLKKTAHLSYIYAVMNKRKFKTEFKIIEPDSEIIKSNLILTYFQNKETGSSQRSW